jgi:autotransporter-associated beta strand protein
MKTLILAAIRCSLMFLLPTVMYAISPQWDLDPISDDWNTAANWTANVVPNGPADIATFGLSHTTNISISAHTEVNGINFTSAATNPYTFTCGPGLSLSLSGTGITNDSGIMQNFVVAAGGPGLAGGAIFFFNTATAGSHTTFTTEGSAFSSFANVGSVVFADASSAGSSTIVNNGGTVANARGGVTLIGLNPLSDTATAASATLIANGGTNGGDGGRILFIGKSSGGTSRIEVFGNGSLEINQENAPGVTIGSLEGDGIVLLGAHTLKVGSNNLSTEFSGEIQDDGIQGSGSLTKIGTGTLTLSGTNTYTGDTNVRRGVLQVDGSIASNTFVKAESRLAGTGTVDGNLTVRGGKVLPGEASGVAGVLTVVHNYTQAQYATLMIQIAGTSAGDFSVLNVLGNANLNGNLAPVLLNGFVPAVGDSFTFLNYASLTGATSVFSQILNQVFNHGTEQWSVIYDHKHAILTVEAHTPGVPDQGSTFLLLTMGLLGLVTYRRQLLRKES